MLNPAKFCTNCGVAAQLHMKFPHTLRDSGCYHPLDYYLAEIAGMLTQYARLSAPLERALAWIDKYGDFDGDGFVNISSRSKAGVNQGWILEIQSFTRTVV